MGIRSQLSESGQDEWALTADYCIVHLAVDHVFVALREAAMLVQLA